MTDKPPKIITTEDGSHSLYNQNLNETYHSFHGAHQESKHVFIRNGLAHLVKTAHPSEINLLEVGFGTGLNAILSLQAAVSFNVKINYQTLETFPLPGEIISELNYKDFLVNTENHVFFDQIHRTPWNKNIEIIPLFSLLKHLTSLQEFSTTEKFDLIYFDAFAPNKQPELWTLEVLKRIAKITAKDGILVTYCAKGQFKRDLETIGYQVEALTGPPGKKEMVRATMTKD